MADNGKHTAGILDEKDALIQKLQDENSYLKRQLEEFKRLIFGSKSERFVPSDDNQLSLFDIPKEEGLGKESQGKTCQRKTTARQGQHTITFATGRGNS